MSEKNFDFRINQLSLINTLGQYHKMVKLMEEKREEQLEIKGKIVKDWKSENAKEAGAVFVASILYGDYDKTYKEIVAMKNLLAESLPKVAALLARCEGFIDELKNDEYIEPITPGELDYSMRNGDVLSINYDIVPQIVSDCNDILNKNNEITRAFMGIVAGCSHLISGTDSDIEALNSASRKIGRIGNFAESLQIYKREVDMLEDDMLYGMGAIRGNRNEFGMQIMSLGENIIPAVQKIYYSNMSKEKVDRLIDVLINENDVQSMLSISNQILTKDADKWTESDVRFIAQTLNYGFETNNSLLVEVYVDDLFSKQETIKCESNIFDMSNYYYTYDPDAPKVRLIMEYLDPDNQGKTYYTLSRLLGIKFETGVIDGNNNGTVAGIDKYDVIAEVNNGELQIKVEGKKYKKEGSEVVGEQYTITATDLGKINPNKLADMGFNNNEIEIMRLNVVTDTDVQFLTEFADLDYKAAFLCNPNEFSDQGKLVFTQAANRIVSSEEYGLEFVNAVLRTDSERCLYLGTDNVDMYLKMFGDMSRIINDCCVAQLYEPSDIFDDPASIEMAKKEIGKNLEIMGMWNLLLEATQSKYYHNLDAEYYYGNYTYRILPQDVDENNEFVARFPEKMCLAVCDQNGEVTLHRIDDKIEEQKIDIRVKVCWSRSEIAANNTMVEIRKLYEDTELKKAEEIFNMVTSPLGFASPVLKTGITVMTGLYKGDFSDTLKPVGRQMDKSFSGSKFETLAGETNHILNYIRIMQDYYINCNKLSEESNLSQMGTGVFGEIGSDTYKIDIGIYNPYMINKLNDWCAGGIIGLTDGELNEWEFNEIVKGINSDLNNDPVSKIYNNIKAKDIDVEYEEVEQCYNLLIYGNDFDGDGNIDCYKKICEINPNVLLYTINTIDGSIQDDKLEPCLEYVCKEY